MTGGTAVTATGVGAENPQYIIAWGDGSFPAIGSSATYTYSTNGSYNLCVTFLDVNNPLACNVTECAMVDVTIDVNELNNWQPTMRKFPVVTFRTLISIFLLHFGSWPASLKAYMPVIFLAPWVNTTHNRLTPSECK
jgi:hypothetical protein